ncbi:PASTA domain-containing protein [Streptomyces mirabilis]|uniref:PASTA domain-containing protein n=1 Tax=Streptomyces mirabilis TaxID=68239 RepID=UPI00333401B2
MRFHIISAAVLCAAAGALVGCDPDTTGHARADSTPTASATPPTPATPATEAKETTDDKPTEAERKAVPDFVGMGLQSAQDAAQAAGFYALTSHDALGRDRLQVFDRNWKVCGQNYEAGKTIPTSTRLDFAAVKLAESCPAKDEKAPEAAQGTMPDFRGKSVKAARAALDSSTSLTVNDASGSDRWILVESNWKVCTQSPSTGTALKGQPVTLNAVKFDETCP